MYPAFYWSVVLLAIMDMLPRMVRSPVEICLGTRPSQAAKSRPRCCRHSVLLVWAPLASLSLAGQEHGRTIPLADMQQAWRIQTAVRARHRPIFGPTPMSSRLTSSHT